ncbi:MAG: sugar transporter [Segetibacter sp.]|nr:sugar transporter [Segetibacter sp.]
MLKCHWQIVTFFSALAVIFFLSSCVSSKNAVYFNNLQDTVFKNVASADLEPTIQKNDLLSISVSSLNPEATVIFNTPNNPSIITGTNTNSISQTTGYLVNKDGNILFPILGNVQAAGLSKRQLTDTIGALLLQKKLLLDPIVNVRFLNFRVTVLGEVARPNVITVPNEKITLLEALGLAGDLTIYAKRDNVLLVREENGQKTIKRINLNSTQVFTSPYYYLKTNDIIYAEPNNTRIASASNTRQFLPLILSGLSFFVIILDRIIR